MKGPFFVALIFVFLSLSASTLSCDRPVTDQSSSTCDYQDYRCMAREDAVNAGIDPDMFERQITMESGFNPSAYSSEGAEGIAQIIQSTADSWGVNPWDPDASLKSAADHMAWYYQHYGYDYGKALACYNAGCGSLEWAEQHCSNYYYCLPASTRHYIDVIEG